MFSAVSNQHERKSYLFLSLMCLVLQKLWIEFPFACEFMQAFAEYELELPSNESEPVCKVLFPVESGCATTRTT